MTGTNVFIAAGARARLRPADRSGTTDKVQVNPATKSKGRAGRQGRSRFQSSGADADDKPLRNRELLAPLCGATALSADYFGAFRTGSSNSWRPAKGLRCHHVERDERTRTTSASAGRSRPARGADQGHGRRGREEGSRCVRGHRVQDDVPLAGATTELTRRHKPTAAELDRARKILDEQREAVLTGSAAVYARESILLAQYADTVPVTVRPWDGDTDRCDPVRGVRQIRLRIKKTSPLKGTFTIELNGYNGTSRPRPSTPWAGTGRGGPDRAT